MSDKLKLHSGASRASYSKEHGKMTLTNRGKVAVAVGLLGVGAVTGIAAEHFVANRLADNNVYNQLTKDGSNVREEFTKGKIDQNRALMLQAPISGTAWEVADSINANKHGALQTLSDELSGQFGRDSIHKGDAIVVSRQDVDNQILNPHK